MESKSIALQEIVPKDLTFFIRQGEKNKKKLEDALCYTAIQRLFIVLVHLPR